MSRFHKGWVPPKLPDDAPDYLRPPPPPEPAPRQRTERDCLLDRLRGGVENLDEASTLFHELADWIERGMR